MSSVTVLKTFIVMDEKIRKVQSMKISQTIPIVDYSNKNKYCHFRKRLSIGVSGNLAVSLLTGRSTKTSLLRAKRKIARAVFFRTDR